MNQHIQSILTIIQQDENISAEQKAAISKSLKDADKELEIVSFKLDRTEKVKRTTAILLEETIEELEQKRKAVEAQNHELEVESSLERVRTQAMSMNKASNLMDICHTVYEELQFLGFHELRNAMINIYEDDKSYFLNYDFAPGAGKTVTRMPYNFHPLVEKQVRETKNAGDAFNEFSFTGKELKDFRELRKKNGEQDDPKLDDCSSLHYFFYSIGTGSIGISTYSPIPEDKLELLKRFRNVFSLAYQRYIDITKAEAQAREAQIETGLERVRSRTLAMQNSAELAETAAVLYQQFKELGEAPDQITIGIINEGEAAIEFWVTMYGEPDNLMYKANIDEPTLMHKIYVAWKEHKKSVEVDLSGKELQDYIQYRSMLSGVPANKNDLMGHRVINVAFFSKGLLSISTPERKPKETIQLLERFAGVFDLTYTRFLDLKLAEAQAHQAHLDLIQLQTEKKRAEDALTELKATQSQLIQSEKMASLGDLTAGIAHEIQNPLNFVNNFSEVSIELIDEMKQELAVSGQQPAKEILDDIRENLEKINHHGKRADAIVKGMLQHSRTSTGLKEPTNINALADEYLRLAYHGLRAKDKSFNATMKTDFDESIGNINIIPQDIGRVILNLITNAFYAVTEKNNSTNSLLPEHKYEPTVTLNTRLKNSKVEISVKDNGNGIPQKIMDKIFQPFFTTKPTGQGTGLGLSLSYDIIKAHGGELKVGTKEGEGSEFIIILPV